MQMIQMKDTNVWYQENKMPIRIITSIYGKENSFFYNQNYVKHVCFHAIQQWIEK